MQNSPQHSQKPLQNAHLAASISPRPWDDPLYEQTPPVTHDFSHVDLFSHDPGVRPYPRVFLQPKPNASGAVLPPPSTLMGAQPRIQRKIVSLGSGRVALDEEPESIVNDGDEQYSVLSIDRNGVYYLRDNWGEKWSYDPITGRKEPIKAEETGPEELSRIRDINDYLKVDQNLQVAEWPANIPKPFQFFGLQTPRVCVESNGMLSCLSYRFGNWTVNVWWPTLWLLKGEGFYPAPNRFGAAPAGEFAVSNYAGEPMPKALGDIAPFPYKTLSGAIYTPEVSTKGNKTMGVSQFRAILKKIGEGKSVSAAVAEVLGD